MAPDTRIGFQKNGAGEAIQAPDPNFGKVGLTRFQAITGLYSFEDYTQKLTISCHVRYWES